MNTLDLKLGDIFRYNGSPSVRMVVYSSAWDYEEAVVKGMGAVVLRGSDQGIQYPLFTLSGDDAPNRWDVELVDMELEELSATSTIEKLALGSMFVHPKYAPHLLIKTARKTTINPAGLAISLFSMDGLLLGPILSISAPVAMFRPTFLTMWRPGLPTKGGRA